MAQIDNIIHEVSKIQERLSVLESNHGAFIIHIDSLKSSIDSMSEKINKPIPWGMFASWTTITVTILSILGGIVFKPMMEHVHEQGHPRSVLQLIGQNKEDIIKRERTLISIQEWCREHDAKMTGISSVQTEKISSMEKGLDRIWNLLRNETIKNKNI